MAARCLVQNSRRRDLSVEDEVGDDWSIGVLEYWSVEVLEGEGGDPRLAPIFFGVVRPSVIS